MTPRPTSSAGLAASERPSTSRPGTDGYFDRDPQYTYSQDYSFDEEDEDDEESDAGDVFAFGPPPTACVSPITPPPPTWDPNARDRVGPPPPTAGPSKPYHRHPYPLSPIESPPSTDSQTHDAEGQYRMRRLGPSTASDPPTSGTGTNPLTGVSSAVSSREVHVSLPGSGKEEGKSGKHRPPSTARSASFPSIDDGNSTK